MKLNNKGFAMSSIIYSILILFILLVFCVLSVLASRKLVLDKIKNEVLNHLNQTDYEYVYKDESGANAPELLDNMVPIKYDGTNWIISSLSEEWYDYDNKRWANAVVLKDGVTKTVNEEITEDDIALWYVWIPRYKYTLFNSGGQTISPKEIDVVFENETYTTGTVVCYDTLNQTDSNGNKVSEVCSDKELGNIIDGESTYTHPAFCLGTKNSDGSCNGDELTGFWVGKFEISGEVTNSQITNIEILPNKTALQGYKVSSYYNAINQISASYEINGDSHMIKNQEWGAVAYLKQSKYGLGNNDIATNTSSTTSSLSNESASTTGNIYGVYDMAGGVYEYVMGVSVNANGIFGVGSSGFNSANLPDAKYYDLYTYDNNNDSITRGKLGDATKETYQFYGDSAFFVSPTTGGSFFRRGSHKNGNLGLAKYAGIFSFECYDGGTADNSTYTTRAILTKK